MTMVEMKKLQKEFLNKYNMEEENDIIDSVIVSEEEYKDTENELLEVEEEEENFGMPKEIADKARAMSALYGIKKTGYDLAK